MRHNSPRTSQMDVWPVCVASAVRFKLLDGYESIEYQLGGRVVKVTLRQGRCADRKENGIQPM